MSGPDALFSLRNKFLLGAYQAAVNEGNVGGLTDAEAVEKDVLVYRSYLALGSHQLVIDEIGPSAPTALQAIKILALYLSGTDGKDQALSSLQELLSDAALLNNSTLLLVAGTIYSHEQNYTEALKFTNSGSTLDLCALNVQIFLKMDRVDYAEKQLKSMQHIDEDATLTQLSNAWVNLALGGTKIQEAFYIFQELGEKYMWTVLLLNGNAVCQMHMGNYEEAEKLLLDALNKDGKDANTLANLIVCCLHLGKPTSRHFNQLRTVAVDHALITRSNAAEANFEQALVAYA
eukprot:SM000074S21714  [mRNA]  locus=s74:540305:542318:+ [translate_table: standard]